MTKEEKAELHIFLSQAGFFDHLSDAQQTDFLNNTQVVSYEKGSMVHSPEKACAGVIFLRTGCLRIYLLSDEGREVTLYRVPAGDFCILSASCVLEAIEFDVFIEAEENANAFLTDAATFQRLAAENVYLRCAGYQKATERFSEVMWAMQQILFRGVDRRLATFLSNEHQRTGSDRIVINQEQIASYIGSSREVVSRMMKYFASEGIACGRRGSVEILDEEKLRRLAQS